MRFAWSMTEEYGRELPGGAASTRLLHAFAAPMRAVDRRRAAEVTRYVATSDWVAEQIRRYYGRASTIIRPPVDTSRFQPSGDGHDGYFLFCGRLVEPYKRPTAVVEAFRRLGLPLVMAGDGPARRELERTAPANVTFTGELGDDELIPLMQRCAALVFPSRDDFGLLPIEVMACGRPVLAFAGGGALETVVAGETGEFFTEQTPEAIAAAVECVRPRAPTTRRRSAIAPRVMASSASARPSARRSRRPRAASASRASAGRAGATGSAAGPAASPPRGAPAGRDRPRSAPPPASPRSGRAGPRGCDRRSPARRGSPTSRTRTGSSRRGVTTPHLRST